jgi:hypothetical protein
MKRNLHPFLLIIIMLIADFSILAQDSLKTDLRSEVRLCFSAGNFIEALPLYHELLKAYPKEPEYQFGAGVCLVQLNGDIEEAIRLLRPVTVAEYSPLTYYYLGRAYHLFYSFDDALKSYSRFMVKGKSADIKLFGVERLIEMARNGIEYTRTGHTVTVQNIHTIQLDQLQQVAEINGTGKLMKKPIEFCSKTDIRNGYRPWMFLPSYTEVNEYVYTAGYTEGKSSNKQLFRIRNVNHETWGIPELLTDIINTQYDEEYPFFDAKTSTLYFSSKGHSSLGGYDIFRSVYDWNSKTWSRPENLGFPINSPADDFVYITDELSHSATFVSTREAAPNRAISYKIKLKKDTTGVRFFNVDEIRKASQLKVEPTKPEEVPLSENVKQFSVVVTDTEIKTTGSDYNKVLAEALQLQIRADSFARITRDLRVAAKEMPGDSVKRQLITDILKHEKEAKWLQRDADMKFSEARKLKNMNTPGQLHADSVVTLAKEINGIAVYQYRTGGSASSIQEIDEKKEDLPVVKLEADVVVQPKKDSFVLEEKSQYNEMNPIPRRTGISSGLTYSIQLGVFSKLKPNDAFGGISPVYYEEVQGSTVLKYYAGVFHSINAVTKALDQIRSKGFPDAFIVAFLDGKMITTEKAREIEFADFAL